MSPIGANDRRKHLSTQPRNRESKCKTAAARASASTAEEEASASNAADRASAAAKEDSARSLSEVMFQ
jgi:hypothetical protein